MAEISAMLLEDLGYECKPVSNAATALETLKIADFDLVFTDIVMPGMDGLQLLSEVRTRHPGTPAFWQAATTM